MICDEMKIDGVVITGATSMLGIALIDECIKNKLKMVAIIREHSINADRLPSSEFLKVIKCNLDSLLNLGYEQFELKGNLVFYHFGWEGTDSLNRHDPYIQAMNIKYTLDAVKLANIIGCKAFIGAGSQAEYGLVSSKISGNTPTNPIIAYGVAKYAASKLSLQQSKKLGIKLVWVRVLSVYGKYDGENTMIMKTISKMVSGQKTSFTKGEQFWDYLSCEDAARAFYLIGLKPSDGAVYCLGSGIVRPLHEFISTIRDCIDPSIEIGFGEIPYQENQVMYLGADISDLTNDTGFVPEITFEQGIRNTIGWFMDQSKQNKHIK